MQNQNDSQSMKMWDLSMLEAKCFKVAIIAASVYIIAAIKNIKKISLIALTSFYFIYLV